MLSYISFWRGRRTWVLRQIVEIWLNTNQNAYVIWPGTDWTLGKWKSNALRFQSGKEQPPLAMCVLQCSSQETGCAACGRISPNSHHSHTSTCSYMEVISSTFVFHWLSFWIMKLLLVCHHGVWDTLTQTLEVSQVQKSSQQNGSLIKNAKKLLPTRYL